MNKQDHINTVIGLYDEIAELENQLERTEAQLEQVRSMQPTYEEISTSNAKENDDCVSYFIAKGRETVYKDAVYSYGTRIRYKEQDDGTYSFESKKNWIDRYITDIPDVMSRVTFERLFSDWLERDYNKALEETKAKLEESE